MPRNDNPEIIHDFFEQDNSSQGHQSKAGGGGWPILNNNPIVGIQKQSGSQITFNATNYTSQSTVSKNGNDIQHVQIPFGSNPSKKAELIRNQPINQQLNLNGYMHGPQGLQAEFQADHTFSGHNLIQRGFSNFESQWTGASGYDSALTGSSERPEATEAPVNFDFLGGQQLMRSQLPGIAQPPPIQPQWINDMQLCQQQLIYKQLQEKHRQHQLQQLQQGITQQNLPRQLSNVAMQSSGNQMPHILSGMPISNAPTNMWSNEVVGSDQRLPGSSPMFLSGNMSWVQRSSMQGIPNGFLFSRDQGQVERNMGFASQQPDQSLYSTAVASTRGSLNHQSQLQGNFHQMNHVSPSLQIQEMSGTLHEKAVEQGGASCGIPNLDPTEEKLLFSAGDEGNQGASFGLSGDRSTGGYLQENLMQTNDYFSSFPTLNSGSWSALMQEAVEASSSDTGLNEEWSGLNFHKTELSSRNPSAKLHDNDRKQQASWDGENLQNASSLSSRPLPLFNDAVASSNGNATPNFQLPVNISGQQNEGAVTSREFFQHSSKETINKPFDQSHQQKQPVGGGVQTQTQTQFNNIYSDVWAGKTSEELANSALSLEAEFNTRNTQDSWAYQKVPLHGHPSNKPNGWNAPSLALSGDKASNCYANNDKRQHVQANNMSRTVNMSTDQNGSLWKISGSQAARSIPSSAGESENVGANTDILIMQNENYCSGNLDAVMNSSNLNLSSGTNQQVVNRHQGDYGKHADVNAFCQNKRGESATKHQNQVRGNPQILDSSMYNTIQRSGECAHKQENRHPVYVLNEGFIPSTSQPAQNTEGGGSPVDSSLLGGNGTRSLANNGLKSLGQSTQRNTGPCKFQFHSMGNLEMNTEPMDSQNNTLHCQHRSPGSKNHEPEYVVHGLFSGHAMNNDPDRGKGHLSDLQRNTNSAAEENNYRGSFCGHSAAPAVNGFTSEFSQNIRTGLTSQNMLELLHKVDQSRATKPLEHVSFEQNTSSARREAETSDGSSSHLQLSQSPSFQGFSLNLAPPSQRQSVSDQALPLQTSLQTANDFNQRNHASRVSEDQSRPPSSASGQSLPSSHDPSQKESQGSLSFLSGHKSKGTMYSNFQGNSLTAAAYDLKRQQSSHDDALANQSSVASMLPPSRLNSSSDTYPVNTGHSRAIVASSHLRSSGQHKPVVEMRSFAHPSATSVVSQQGGISTRLHNVWTSISSQQHLSGIPPQKIISNVLQSKNPFSSDGESLQAPRMLDNHKRKVVGSSSEIGTSAGSQQFMDAEDHPAKDIFSQRMPPSDSVDVDSKKANASQGPVREPELKYHSNGNPNVSLCSAASSSCDTGAFGHPLGLPDAQKQNNYSLLQQMQAMKDADSDPTQRHGKRLKGADFNVDTSQGGQAVGQGYIYGQNTVLRETDATSQNTSFPSDVKMLSFSSRDNKENSANMSLLVIGREVQSQNLLIHKQHNVQNHSHPQGKTSTVPSAGGSECSLVSPQMAPSWFEKYGNFNNGQPVTTYDGVSSFQRNSKASVQNYVVPKVSEGIVLRVVPEEKEDANHVGSFQQSTPSTVLLSNSSVSSPGHSQVEAIDKNMILVPKKRKSALDLLPWHKEVTQGFRRLQNISIMEQEWAWATNRLIDKLEEEFETIEDGLSMSRSRRRLILTTQLMQQILPAVPSRFLSADAGTSYESVIYVMAKLILGDACSLTSSGGDSRAVLDNENMTLGKHNESAREGFARFSRIVEEVIGRSKKLENDFLRLDSRVSILDVRLECQDLERNSIMNRFAKFHGRSHTDVIESSSNIETAPRRAYPQRHVTVHAMPTNLPEDVICLSL